MALIGHRCGCRHTDLKHHRAADGTHLCAAAAGASCPEPCTGFGEAEAFPTFDINGRPVERIIPPGDGIHSQDAEGGDGGIVVSTCGCQDCHALYRSLAHRVRKASGTASGVAA
jgi:hypothetical protein